MSLTLLPALGPLSSNWVVMSRGDMTFCAQSILYLVRLYSVYISFFLKGNRGGVDLEEKGGDRRDGKSEGGVN